MRIKVSEKEKFVLRAAGIFIRGKSVLLHRAEHEDIWALPGGGCEFFEDAESALVREAREELDASIKIISLAFTVENFFKWSGDKAHEIGFYFRAEFVGNSIQFYDRDQFIGIEKKMEGFKEFRLFFKWFPIDGLDAVNVKPDFLKNKLQRMQEHTSHVVQREI